MLLRRFGGRRRLDIVLGLFVLGKATGAGCLPASNGVQKKGRVFFSGSVWLSIGHGRQLDNRASEKVLGTAGPQKYYSNVSKKQVAR